MFGSSHTEPEEVTSWPGAQTGISFVRDERTGHPTGTGRGSGLESWPAVQINHAVWVFHPNRRGKLAAGSRTLASFVFIRFGKHPLGRPKKGSTGWRLIILGFLREVASDRI